MTSALNVVDLREVPIGTTVRIVTKSGTLYQVTRSNSSRDQGTGIIGGLRIESDEHSDWFDDAAQGTYSAFWYIEVDRPWYLNTEKGNVWTRPVASITIA